MMHWTLRIAISLVLIAVAGVARAGSEDEVKALFAKFVAAQNAHDLKAVGELLHELAAVPVDYSWHAYLGSRRRTQALRAPISRHLVSRSQDG